MFNFSMRESVKLLTFGLCRLDLSHVIMLRRVSFYNLLSVTDNSILSGLFWSYLLDYFNIDNYLNIVFKPVSTGKRGVYELLDQYVIVKLH